MAVDNRSWQARWTTKVVLATVGTVVVLATLWVLLGQGALWMLHHVDGVNGLRGKERAEALDTIRGRVVTLTTGILAIIAIYYTAANARTARQTLEHAQDAALRAFQLAEQGQVTERYTKAIEQLVSRA